MMKKITFEKDADTDQWTGIVDGDPDLIIHLCNFCGTLACDCRDYPGPCILCEEFKETVPRQITTTRAHDSFAIESGFH